MRSATILALTLSLAFAGLLGPLAGGSIPVPAGAGLESLAPVDLRADSRGIGPEAYPSIVNTSVSIDPTERNNGRKLVRLDNGTLVAAWEDTGVIYAAYSTDQGKTWSTATDLSQNGGGGTIQRPALGTNGTTIFAAWRDTDDMVGRASTDGGRTWTPDPAGQNPCSVDNGPGFGVNHDHPSVAMTGAWTFVAFDRNSIFEDIRVRRTTNAVGCAGWSSAPGVTGGGNQGRYPSIAAAPGRVVLVWQENPGGGDYDILMRQSIDNAATWTAGSFDVSQNGGASTSPSVAANGTSFIVTWQDDTAGDFDILARKWNTSGVWSPPIGQAGRDLSQNAGDSLSPSVAMTSDGLTVAVLWVDDTTVASNDTRIAVERNGTWAAAKVLTADALGDSWLTAEHDITNGLIEWVWTGNTTLGTPYEVFYDYYSTGATSDPSLNWTGDAGYTVDGLQPDRGSTLHTYTYKVEYTDADNDPPEATFPQVWIDRNNDMDFLDPLERRTMSEVSAADTTYTDGKDYTFSTTFPSPGTYGYRFIARDDSHRLATGTPNTRIARPIVYTSTPPSLDWTGEADYTADGLDPETGDPSTTFTYRIKYTENDNESPAAGFPLLLLDIDGDGAFNGSSDVNTLLTEVDALDTNVSDGKLYSFARTFATPNINYSYRFIVFDEVMEFDATPVLLGPRVFKLTAAPTLDWVGADPYLADGLEPETGSTFTKFTYKVRYADPDGDAPLAGAPEVWVDRNRDIVQDPAEWAAMAGSDAADTTFVDGKTYEYNTTLTMAGTYSYAFRASDINNKAAAGPPTMSKPGPVVRANLPPNLVFTGEPNYAAAGVNPLSGSTHTSKFEYRVHYSDLDDDAPRAGYPQVWIDLDMNGAIAPGEQLAMTQANPLDTTYDNGKIYTFTTNFSVLGTSKYRFAAIDVADATASLPPVTTDYLSGPTIASEGVPDRPPLLDWTGQGAFTDRGVDPLVGGPATVFQYRVEYSDRDGDAPAGGGPTLWFDRDGDGNFTGSGEKLTMSPASGSGANYVAGVVYEASLQLPMGDHSYQFSAMDDNATQSLPALGPATVKMPGPSVIINNPPTLRFPAAPFDNGVDPDGGEANTTFTFKVAYTDADDDAPEGGAPILWLDLDRDGTIDAAELLPMEKEIATDIIYTDGADYRLTKLLDTDGTYLYRVTAQDTKRTEASGDPTVNRTVVVKTLPPPPPPPNRAPELRKPVETDFTNGVKPTKGDPKTSFTFRVLYVDLDNDAPAAGTPALLLDYGNDGSPDRTVPMTAIGSGTDWAAGVAFEAVVTDLPVGTVGYRVKASDEKGLAAPDFGPYAVPIEKKGTTTTPGAMFDWLWLVILIVVAVVVVLAIAMARRKKSPPLEEASIEPAPRHSSPPSAGMPPPRTSVIDVAVEPPAPAPAPHPATTEVHRAAATPVELAPGPPTEPPAVETPAAAGDAPPSTPAPSMDDEIDSILKKI